MGETVKAIDLDLIASKPDGWDAIKLRQAFVFGKGLNITKDDLTEDGIPVISYGQIHSKTNTGTGLNETLLRYVPKTYLRRCKPFLTRRNDFLFADTSEDYAGIGNCVFVDSDDTIFAGYHTIIARPVKSSIIPKYLAYMFQTDFWRAQIRSQVMGVKVFSVTQALLRNTFVLVPPIEEQRQMIAILDKECAKIDSIISDLEQQIICLRHYRRQTINEAVTKGIKQEINLKDSGNPFVGVIAESAEAIRFKYVAQIDANLVDPIKYATMPQVSPENIVPNMGTLVDVRTVEETSVDSWNQRFHKGHIIYSKIRPALNKVTIAPFDGLCSADMYPISTDLPTRYLMYYMLSDSFVLQTIDVSSIRVKMPKVNQEEMKNFIVVVHSEKEMEEIADCLDRKCAVIDSLLHDKEVQLKQMTKQRQSLIFEYVTGKKRVEEVSSHAD